jgi:hypothetical protein
MRSHLKPEQPNSTISEFKKTLFIVDYPIGPADPNGIEPTEPATGLRIWI